MAARTDAECRQSGFCQVMDEFWPRHGLMSTISAFRLWDSNCQLQCHLHWFYCRLKVRLNTKLPTLTANSGVGEENKVIMMRFHLLMSSVSIVFMFFFYYVNSTGLHFHISQYNKLYNLFICNNSIYVNQCSDSFSSRFNRDFALTFNIDWMTFLIFLPTLIVHLSV